MEYGEKDSELYLHTVQVFPSVAGLLVVICSHKYLKGAHLTNELSGWRSNLCIGDQMVAVQSSEGS